jgi:hypothetical protein
MSSHSGATATDVQPSSMNESLAAKATVPEPPQSTMSRRQRNNQRQQMDMEFATEIGQNLLQECRRLQALLSDRDQAISKFVEEREGWEAERDGLVGAIRVAESSVGELTHQAYPRIC